MGNAGAQAYGMDKAWTPVEDAVAGLVKAVSTSPRASLRPLMPITGRRGDSGDSRGQVCHLGWKRLPLVARTRVMHKTYRRVHSPSEGGVECP